MILFGIDPGTTVTGFGVISTKGNTVRWIDSGVITPRPKACLSEKLQQIYDGLMAKLSEHHPDTVCVEQAFYAKNVHTTLILGHARGVAILAAQKSGADVVEYSPREIKKSIVGNGNAAKEQIVYMIKMLLAPPTQHAKTDAYDALAIALCGFYRGGGLRVAAI